MDLIGVDDMDKNIQNLPIAHPFLSLPSLKSKIMDGTVRADIRAGMRVRIVLKEHQRSGTLTEGLVKDILTSSPSHPHGIKVRLQDGKVGRVKEIIT